MPPTSGSACRWMSLPLVLAASWLISAIGLSACGPDDFGSVRLGLDGVPERVRTISVTVWDVETEAIVTSATVAPEQSGVDVGVPAERPLEFRVLARSDLPGPLSLGGSMPAYYAAVRRTIPLGSDRLELTVTLRPAGALTIQPIVGEELSGPLRTTITADDTPGPGRSITANPSSTTAVTLPLTAGTYSLGIAEGGPFRVRGGVGFFVARDTESIGRFEVSLRPEERPEGAPRQLFVTVRQDGREIDGVGIIATSSAGAEFEVAVEGIDGDGASVSWPGEVCIRTLYFPPELGSSATQCLTGVPATFDSLAVEAMHGRARIAVSLDDGEADPLRATRAISFSPAGAEGGDGALMSLAIADSTDLFVGTELIIEVVDAAGRYARATEGTIDLGGSDPWMYFATGDSLWLSRRDGGIVRSPVARPSAPRGLQTTVRAVLTSTAAGLTLTASTALPSVEVLP